MTCAALLARRGDRRPLVAIAWVAIAFLPASNLLVPTGQLLAERTLYLPSVGVALLVAWGINVVYARVRVNWAERSWRSSRRGCRSRRWRSARCW